MESQRRLALLIISVSFSCHQIFLSKSVLLEARKSAPMKSFNPISRRTLLRKTGAVLALPFFESLFPARVASAATVAKPPVRLGIFTVTGGTVLESWKPKEAGPLTKLPSLEIGLNGGEKNYSFRSRDSVVARHRRTARSGLMRRM